MEARNDRCSICGCSLDKTTTLNDNSFTEDHVIPKSRGGTNATTNKRPCCRRCNLLKGNLPWSRELDCLISLAREAEIKTGIRVRRIEFVRKAKKNANIFRVHVTKAGSFEILVRETTIQISALDQNMKPALVFSEAMQQISKRNFIVGKLKEAAGITTVRNTFTEHCAFCGKKVHGTPNTDCVIICKSCYTHLSQAASLCKKIYKVMSCTY